MADKKVPEKKEEKPTQDKEKEKIDEKEGEKIDEKEKKTEDQKKRTQERFEKLEKSNKGLKKDVEKYKNVLDSILPTAVVPQKKQEQYTAPVSRPPQEQQYSSLTQQDIDTQFKDMVDEDGYLDGVKLTKTLQEMDMRARRAEQRAEKVAKQAELREVASLEAKKTEKAKALHSKYPQLDPENKEVEFDERLYEAVRNELVSQMIKGVPPGQEDPVAAADKWMDILYMNKKEKERADKKEEAKRQINATTPRPRFTAESLNQDEENVLREKAKRGVKGALGELLKRREA